MTMDFAIMCLLVSNAIALYPVSVRQLADLLHASFRPRLAAASLRFATLHRHQIVSGLSPPSC